MANSIEQNRASSLSSEEGVATSGTGPHLANSEQSRAEQSRAEQSRAEPSREERPQTATDTYREPWTATDSHSPGYY